jgi:hypothetical protein
MGKGDGKVLFEECAFGGCGQQRRAREEGEEVIEYDWVLTLPTAAGTGASSACANIVTAKHQQVVEEDVGSLSLMLFFGLEHIGEDSGVSGSRDMHAPGA